MAQDQLAASGDVMWPEVTSCDVTIVRYVMTSQWGRSWRVSGVELATSGWRHDLGHGWRWNEWRCDHRACACWWRGRSFGGNWPPDPETLPVSAVPLRVVVLCVWVVGGCWLFVVPCSFVCLSDCELQQVLRIARRRNSSEALVHALEFEAAKSASRYINGFMPSHCSQKIPVSHCRYDGWDVYKRQHQYSAMMLAVT